MRVAASTDGHGDGGVERVEADVVAMDDLRGGWPQWGRMEPHGGQRGRGNLEELLTGGE
jgi:hypothetical protein